MIVSQLDSNGYFVCAAEADESPLEPGVFLIPAGAVEVAPPEVPAGMKARLADGEWVLESATESNPPDELPPAPTSAHGWATQQRLALSALADSDITIIRCAEAGVPVPQAWRDYRSTLRQIVSSDVGDPDPGLPERPAYPPGT